MLKVLTTDCDGIWGCTRAGTFRKRRYRVDAGKVLFGETAKIELNIGSNVADVSWVEGKLRKDSSDVAAAEFVS